MPYGYTTVTASLWQNAQGAPLNNATASFTPATSDLQITNFRAGGPLGAVANSTVSVPVINGGFSINLFDTSLTSPLNIGYLFSLTDDEGNSLLSKGYGFIQPVGATWSFDTYNPNVGTTESIQSGPAGPPATFLGPYSSAVTYTEGQAVSVVDASGNTSTYVSLTSPNLGNSPLAPNSAVWGLLASSGLNEGVAGLAEAAINYAAPGSSTYSAGFLAAANPSYAGAGTAYMMQLLGSAGLMGGWLESIELTADSAGSVTILIGAYGGGNYVTDKFEVTVAQGFNKLYAGIDYNARQISTSNQYIGFWTSTVRIALVASSSYFWSYVTSTEPVISSYPISAWAYSGGGLGFGVQFNLRIIPSSSSNELALVAAEATAGNALLYAAPDNSTYSSGYAPTLAGGVGAAVAYMMQIDGSAGLQGGYLESVELAVVNAGPITILIGAYAGGNYVTDKFEVTAVAGYNKFYAGLDYTPRKLSGSNQYIGFWSDTVSLCAVTAGTYFWSYPTSTEPVISTTPIAAWAYSGGGLGFAIRFNCRIVPSLSGVSTTTEYASALGCQFTSGHDDAGIINQFLASTSAASPVHLIMDGLSFVSGVQIPVGGYVTISGTNRYSTGFQLLPGTGNNCVNIGPYAIANPNYDDSSEPSLPAQSCAYVTLRSMAFRCDGVSGNIGANLPIAGAPAHSVFSVSLANATHVTVESCNFFNPPDYNLQLTNVSDARVSDCYFESGGYTQDGIHLDGPANNIIIHGCEFQTGDDAIALNAPEGFGGNIDNVMISQCRFNNCFTAMRIYTSFAPTHQFFVTRVSVIGCIVNPIVCGFLLGLEADLGTSTTAPPAQIDKILIANNIITALAPQNNYKGAQMLVVMNTVGSLVLSDNIFYPSANAAASPILGVLSYGSIDDLIIDGLTISRDATNNAVPTGVVLLNGSAQRISLDGIRVADPAGSSFGALSYVVEAEAALGTLRIDSVDMLHFSAVHGSAGTANVSSYAGNGMLGTGLTVPDAQMSNLYPYLSSSLGAPALKVAGAIIALGGGSNSSPATVTQASTGKTFTIVMDANGELNAVSAT